MKDEEAIKRLKYDISAGEYSTTKTEVLETVLNLIQKQQAEIEKKDTLYHKALHDLVISEHEHKYDIKIIDEVKGEAVKLYKIIDLMAEQLTTPEHNKEWVIDYYKNKIQEEN